MRLLILILLTFPFSVFSQQQTVVLCDYNKTEFIYSVNPGQPGTLEWRINGEVFPGQTLMIDWKDYSFGNYTLTVTFYSGGCEAKQSFEVNLKECPDIIVWIPSTFTPNGDGVNEIFVPESYNLQPDEYSFEIYNRWGEKIFFSRDFSVGWDGTYTKRFCPDGVYAYKIFIREGKKTFYSVGRVTLLR